MRFIYFFLTIFPYLIYSQDITDAINWSIENESGNARYSAMGGAFGALGGNLSAISSNPASGAVFELSRFGGSLVSNINQTKSNFKSNISKKIKYRLEERVKTDSLDIKKISFEIDRFILDNNLSKHYNKLTNSYDISQETSFDLSTSVTTFDGDGTRFFARIDTYVDKDEGDLYIKFPQVGVFDRLPYTER